MRNHSQEKVHAKTAKEEKLTLKSCMVPSPTPPSSHDTIVLEQLEKLVNTRHATSSQDYGDRT